MDEERLVISAVWVDDGQRHVHQPRNIDTGFVITGYRHCNCHYTLYLMGQIELTMDGKRAERIPGQKVDGFLSNKNNFYNRKDALEIAKKANQIINKDGKLRGGTQLTSEDLWLSYDRDDIDNNGPKIKFRETSII